MVCELYLNKIVTYKGLWALRSKRHGRVPRCERLNPSPIAVLKSQLPRVTVFGGEALGGAQVRGQSRAGGLVPSKRPQRAPRPLPLGEDTAERVLVMNQEEDPQRKM